MNYRVKQFFWGLTAKLSKEDKELVVKYLDSNELKLFYRLPRYEQLHSVKVARCVLEESKLKKIMDIALIKAAFLHDIGKINSGLNIFTKSILVILDKISPKLLKRLVWLKIVNVYYNHPEIAIDYLDKSDERLKYYILNHHNYKVTDDEKLRLIHKADSKH